MTPMLLPLLRVKRDELGGGTACLGWGRSPWSGGVQLTGVGLQKGEDRNGRQGQL